MTHLTSPSKKQSRDAYTVVHCCDVPTVQRLPSGDWWTQSQLFSSACEGYSTSEKMRVCHARFDSTVSKKRRSERQMVLVSPTLNGRQVTAGNAMHAVVERTSEYFKSLGRRITTAVCVSVMVLLCRYPSAMASSLLTPGLYRPVYTIEYIKVSTTFPGADDAVFFSWLNDRAVCSKGLSAPPSSSSRAT